MASGLLLRDDLCALLLDDGVVITLDEVVARRVVDVRRVVRRRRTRRDKQDDGVERLDGHDPALDPRSLLQAGRPAALPLGLAGQDEGLRGLHVQPQDRGAVPLLG